MKCAIFPTASSLANRFRCWVATTATLLSFSTVIMGSGGVARATLVSLDFNTTGGQTATGDVGVFTGQTGGWNVLALGASSTSALKSNTPSTLNMTAGDGSGTTIDFYLNTASASSSAAPGTTTTWKAFASATSDDLREDVAFLSSDPNFTSALLFWVIEGLVPNGVYNLAFYGQTGFANAGKWTIDATALENWNGSAVTGQVVFNNIVASPSGIIGGQFEQSTNDPSLFGAWSGLQIQSVPEPSGLALFLFGGVMLWFFRRKRS